MTYNAGILRRSTREFFNELMLSDSSVFHRTSELEVFHYTTSQTACSIITSNSFWMTHAAQSNDTSEFKFLREKLYDTQYFDEKETIKTAIDNSVDTIFTPFCTSFCRKPDLLSQFARYGNICIGFDLNKLRSAKWRGQSGLLYGNVVYDPPVHSAIAAHLINLAEKYIPDIRGQLDQVVSFSIAYAAYVHFRALLVKHPGFSEENEYRMAYMKIGDSLDSIPVERRNAGNREVDYVIIKPDPGILPISKIIVSPTTSEKDIEGIRTCLDTKGHSEVRIIPSAIPLRQHP